VAKQPAKQKRPAIPVIPKQVTIRTGRQYRYYAKKFKDAGRRLKPGKNRLGALCVWVDRKTV
jgi:hypothetical protein